MIDHDPFLFVFNDLLIVFLNKKISFFLYVQ